MRGQWKWSAILQLLAACRTNGPPGPDVVSDSAGIQITRLTRSPIASGVVWTVAPEPELDIGVREGEPPYELDRVVAARRLSDGSIVIANSGVKQLRLFSKEGRYIRTIGGEGEGPGEFQSMAWVQVLPADTLLVTDPDLRRVSAFTPDGVHQWTVTMQGTGYAWPGDSRLPDGTFVLVTETGDVWQRIQSGQTRAGQTDRNTSVMARYDSKGTLIDTIGRFPGYEEAILERQGRVATTYPPWGRLITHALGPDRLYVGTQESSEVRAYLLDGLLAALVRWPAGDLSITDADLETFNAVQFELARDDSATRQAIVTRTRSLPLPPSRPAYGRIVVDHAGLLWISEAHVPIAAPRHWTVIEPGVGARARVDMPGHFDVYEIGLKYVLGRWTDEDGVQHVRLHELRRH
jgi:hypothetical protein